MITNLFSTFDPATRINLSLNWSRTIIGIFMIPTIYWILPNRVNILINNLWINLYGEFKILLGKKSYGITLLIIRLFIFILFNNIMGLLPYLFTRRRHLSFTLAIALPIWLRLIIFGWTNKSQEIFAHLIPIGTPAPLMPFIVIIESIRNLIRPGSLAVRLTANIIAGHLLIRLLGNNIVRSNNIILPFIFIVQIGLIIFEVAVSIIQAYVFSVLTTLYSREVNYEKTQPPIPFSGL